MKDTGRFCPAQWFSGFFGLAAIAHLVRLAFGVPIQIGTVSVPMAASVWVAVIAGALSVGLLAAAIRRPCSEDRT